MASVLPNLLSHSHLQDVLAVVVVLNFTAWWQRCMCMNDLIMHIMRQPRSCV